MSEDKDSLSTLCEEKVLPSVTRSVRLSFTGQDREGHSLTYKESEILLSYNLFRINNRDHRIVIGNNGKIFVKLTS
jgi:hypothetical protein